MNASAVQSFKREKKRAYTTETIKCNRFHGDKINIYLSIQYIDATKINIVVTQAKSRWCKYIHVDFRINSMQL